MGLSSTSHLLEGSQNFEATWNQTEMPGNWWEMLPGALSAGLGAVSSLVPKGPLIVDGFRSTFYISFLVAFASVDYLQEPRKLLFCSFLA